MKIVDVLDTLTGIFTRKSLAEKWIAEEARARRFGHSLSLLMIDLDHFKSINDGFGHARGDQVLQEFSSTLKNFIRETDIPFRYGGDEFLLLLPNTNIHEATIFGNRLLDHLKKHVFSGEPPLSITVSIGVATFPKDGQNFEETFHAADQRSYLAKRNGRAQVVGDDALQAERRKHGWATVSRLIGRDEALENSQKFLEGLKEKHLNFLEIKGLPGVGRSRFLSAVCDQAKLQGFGVLRIQGSLVLQQRYFGALHQASHLWSGLPAPEKGLEPFARALHTIVRARELQGLVIAVDDGSLLDEGTRGALSFLLDLEVWGKAALVSVDLALPGMNSEDHFQSIALRPLRSEEVRVFLRQAINWDVPAEFLSWFFEQTGGLPANIERGFAILEEQRILLKTDSMWQWLKRDFALAERLRIPDRVIGNLPIGLPLLVGRHTELGQLEHALQHYQLITLEGPGGVGKTRLALQVAAENQPLFSEGTYFVPLANVQDAASVPGALAAALDIPLSDLSPIEQIQRVLGSCHTLLVLDNLEQIEGIGQVVRDLTVALPHAHFLVTSRQRMHLPEEHVLVLEGLVCPSIESTVPVENCPAVQMFDQLARQTLPSFLLSAENKMVIAKLCRLVNGLPLAIKLMAPWVTAFSIEGILEVVEQEQALLVPAIAGKSQSRQTIFALLRTFWEHLSNAEQGVLLGLSVFSGGFTPQAAHEVAGASLFFLDALAGKQYLQRHPAGRYSMHGVLKQFAVDRLTALPKIENQTRKNYVQWAAKFIDFQCHQWDGPQKEQSLKIMKEDWHNMCMAWQIALEDDNFEALQTSLDGFFRYLQLIGRFQIGADQCRQALAYLQSQPIDVSPLLLGRMNIYLSEFLFHLGDYPQSLEVIGLAKSLLEDRYPDSLIMIDIYDSLANSLRALGKFEQVEPWLQRALEICHINQSDIKKEVIINHLGVNAFQQGNLQQAREYFQQYLDAVRKKENIGDLAKGSNNLANVLLRLGDLDSARQIIDESIIWVDQIQSGALKPSIYDSAGQIAFAQGESVDALMYLVQAVYQCLEIQAWPLLLEVFTTIGKVWYQMGNTRKAIGLLQAVATHPAAVYEVSMTARNCISEFAGHNAENQPLKMTNLSLEEIATKVLQISQEFLAAKAGSGG